MYRIWYTNSNNNGGRGYMVHHDSLNDLFRAEGTTVNYHFEGEGLYGIVMKGVLLGPWKLSELPVVRT